MFNFNLIKRNLIAPFGRNLNKNPEVKEPVITV